MMIFAHFWIFFSEYAPALMVFTLFDVTERETLLIMLHFFISL